MDEANGAIRSGEAMTDKPTGPLTAEDVRILREGVVPLSMDLELSEPRSQLEHETIYAHLESIAKRLLASRQSGRPEMERFTGTALQQIYDSTTGRNLFEFWDEFAAKLNAELAAVLPPDGLTREQVERAHAKARRIDFTTRPRDEEHQKELHLGFMERLTKELNAALRATPAPQGESMQIPGANPMFSQGVIPGATPAPEPDFGTADEVIAGLDAINAHNEQVRCHPPNPQLLKQKSNATPAEGPETTVDALPQIVYGIPGATGNFLIWIGADQDKIADVVLSYRPKSKIKKPRKRKRAKRRA